MLDHEKRKAIADEKTSIDGMDTNTIVPREQASSGY